MHEQFVSRLVAHPVFRNDRNLMIFLEYEKELNVRGKNKKEKLVGEISKLLKRISVREQGEYAHMTPEVGWGREGPQKAYKASEVTGIL